ncbi:MAG: CHAT domain-containing protein, partial [Planctomycetota bacterium]
MSRSRLANLTIRGPSAGEPAQHAKLLEDARRNKERAERALAQSSAAFRQNQARARIGFKEVSAALPAGSALLAYARYDSVADRGHLRAADRQIERVAAREATTQYVAFVLISGEAEAAVVPLGAAERIEALIRQWNDAVATAPPVVPAAARAAERGYREAGERLRRAIWDPVAKRLRGSVRIFVVPDAALHLVSLATLPTDDGAYLIETGPMLHYLSTERDLEVATEERAFGRGLLVLGSPDFDHRPIPPPAGGTTLVASAGTPAAPRSDAAPSSYYRGTTTSCDAFRARRWDPLPGTRAEAEEIVSLWSKETSAGASGTAAVMNLTGTAASEAAFKR